MKKLQNLLSEGVVKSYKGSQRNWMENGDEDRIYAALATQDHQSFVDLVVADALGKSFSLAG